MPIEDELSQGDINFKAPEIGVVEQNPENPEIQRSVENEQKTPSELGDEYLSAEEEAHYKKWLAETYPETAVPKGERKTNWSEMLVRTQPITLVGMSIMKYGLGPKQHLFDGNIPLGPEARLIVGGLLTLSGITFGLEALWNIGKEWKNERASKDKIQEKENNDESRI